MKYYGKRDAEEIAFHKAMTPDWSWWTGISHVERHSRRERQVCEAPEVLAYDLVTQQFHFLVSPLEKCVQVQKKVQKCLHIVLFAIRENWKQTSIGGQWLNNQKFIHALDYSGVTKAQGRQMWSYMKTSKTLLDEKSEEQNTQNTLKEDTPQLILVVISRERSRIDKRDFCSVRKLTMRMYLCVNCVITRSLFRRWWADLTV